MMKNTLKAGLGMLALAGFSWPAAAVTVNIDIETQGEPVPGTEITFQTPEGEEITPLELVAVPAEESEEGTGTPASQTDEDKPDVPDNSTDQPATPTFRVELPDNMIGKDVVVVVSKNDELVKREPVKLQTGDSNLAIEAYDPADAGLSLDISQPEICRRKNDCGYKFTVANEGNGIYTGPLFLEGRLFGTVAGSDGQDESWMCQYAGRGKQLCHLNVSLQPGETKSWMVSARLPGRLSQRASNCLRISLRNEEPSGRSDPVVQAVQAGLASLGINTGRPDGVKGPRTRAAIAAFAEEQGLDPETDVRQIFNSLFGISVDRLARLGLEKAEDCEKLALVAPPKKKKRKVSRRKRRDYDDEDDDYNPAVGIGVGIGLGIMNRRLHRERDHYGNGWGD